METLIIPRRIDRAFLKAHPDWSFIFGGTHYGNIYAGQGEVCIGMPNCYKIPTKYRNCKSDTSAFFRDDHFDIFLRPIIDTALNAIPLDTIIIPFRKIGCGCAELPVRAPRTLQYIQERIAAIQYPKIVYHG